jgi:glycogen operon protein
MTNMYWDRLDFDLPTVPGREWAKAIDTFQASPHDIEEPGAEPKVSGKTCSVEARSVVVLVNRPAR